MMDAPTLSTDDIHGWLTDRLAASGGDRRLVALFGRGDPGVIETREFGEFEVRPVTSELELRRHLPAPDAEPRPIAFLVPWSAGELPVDIAGRFVKNGRIFRVDKQARLRTFFGGTEPDHEVTGSALGAYLLAQDVLPDLSVAVARVTMDVAWQSWLQVMWGVPSGALARDTLLAWAATNGLGPQFVDAMGAPEAVGLRAALTDHLRRHLGETGAAIWDAWSQGNGRALLEFAVLFEALADLPDREVSTWLDTMGGVVLGWSGDRIRAVAGDLGAAAGLALGALEQRGEEQLSRQVLLDAQARVTVEPIRRHLIRSPRLPVAWEMRLGAIGEALEAGASAPSPAAFARAWEALRELESHAAFKDEHTRQAFEQAEMTTRLLGWLAVRPDKRFRAGRNAHANVEALGRWYCAEGGYVDWARRRARTGDQSEFGRGVRAVLEKVDGIRIDLDRRFAAALPEWLRAHRPEHEVLPIDKIVARMVVPFVKGREGRRLLVLLLDGMAWAQAVEVLDSLGPPGGQPWAPLAWHGGAEAQIGNSFFAPVIAALPTITSVSRAAFFAGKPLKAGARQSTQDDVGRWEQHSALRELFPDPRVPKLLLKAEAFEQDGTASRDAIALVEDPSQPVVALVVNAIDDYLKSTTQSDMAWTADSIRAFRDLLAAARESGRAVLLASDHGNVQGHRFSSVKVDGERGGARWRPWRADEPLREYEVGIPADLTWAPRGAHGVVLLTDDAHCYGASSHWGEHGGATLAEVLAPAILIGWEGMAGRGEHDRDDALEQRPIQPPGWWYFDVVEPAEPTPRKRKAQSTKTAPKPSPQLPLPQTQLITRGTRAVLEQLRSSKIFEARIERSEHRAEALRAVEYLLEREDRAPAAAFASAMGKHAFRVGGLVARLGELLNIDGYEVIRHDPATHLVLLNREQLAQGFELEL